MPRLRFDPSCRPSEFTCEVWLDPAPEPVRARAARWMADLRALRSRAPVASARPPSRRKRVLSNISKRGLGVEIGPSIDPIAPKREGYRVHIIDHVDRQALIAKYIDDPVELDLIEEVDFVWRGESYLELTGRPKQYDWIIASHVIEHTPDLVAFLVDCDSILKDDGVLSLVIPDKRYVFDRFRPVTGLARVVDAHVTGRREPSAGAVAEHHLYAGPQGAPAGLVAGCTRRLQRHPHHRGHARAPGRPERRLQGRPQLVFRAALVPVAGRGPARAGLHPISRGVVPPHRGLASST
jgi:SAM-dependent methyltransferase